MRLRTKYLLGFLIIMAMILGSHGAWAVGTGGGGAMPWDTTLNSLATDLTGPTAYSLALIALACCGFALAFGGEMNHFVRGVVYVVLVVALLTGATAGATALGLTGAVVA
jgi:type IV secretory pathway VirB2 component (pilin)